MTNNYAEFDLNIDNYSLDELLELFKLQRNFTANEFKEAKKIVLATHPDKSKLDKQYFIFFSKAYKLLFKVNEFKNKKTNLNVTQHGEMTYEEFMGLEANSVKREDSAEQKIVNKISKKANFNQWFNDAFEKNYVKQDEENGHGDWFSSNDDIDIDGENDNEKFKNMKRRNKEHAITLAGDPSAIEGGSRLGANGFSLGSSNSSYGGGDLRTVYKDECVLSVDESDYDESKRYSSIEELKQARGSQNIKPMNNEEAKRQLLERHNEEKERDTTRAMRLVEEEETYKKQTKSFWSSLLKITNN